MAITGLHEALSLAIQPVKQSCSLPEGWIRDLRGRGCLQDPLAGNAGLCQVSINGPGAETIISGLKTEMRGCRVCESHDTLRDDVRLEWDALLIKPGADSGKSARENSLLNRRIR